jgi:2-hydroxychromene-2-carboxylate isomerase
MFDATQFVFSFRSPYAWIAARWVLPKLPASLEVEWRPFFPLPSFDNFPPILEAKTKYLVRDVLRLVKHYGGEVQFPLYGDPNWAIPHCAFLAAKEQGRGREFALATFEARWGRGENPTEPAVLEKLAQEVGIDPALILDTALSEASQQALTQQVQRDYDEQDIFGVPTLILPRGTRFWGHDRIEWALREGLITG